MSDPMIVNPLVIKTRIIWPKAAQIKECAEILKEGQLDTGPDQAATEYVLISQHMENIPHFCDR
jgi:hypothetical protein